MNNSIGTYISMLTEKDNKAGCGAMQALELESAVSDRVYASFDLFSDMLEIKNSYVRNRALILIAANAKWDSENKLEIILDRYLLHITDEKPITSRQCIKGLPEIAKCKPLLKDKIISALMKADTSKYADSMRPLVDKDIAAALDNIRGV